MKPQIPRDLSGQDLVRLLAPFGYMVTRQTGSHVRLTTKQTVNTTSRSRTTTPYGSERFRRSSRTSRPMLASIVRN